MNNIYVELKKKHQTEMNDFPKIVALSNEQLVEGMRSKGLKPSDTKKLKNIGYGVFVLLDDWDKYKDMVLRHKAELDAAIKQDETGSGFIYTMFDYELANHEYCVTGEVEDALNALGLTLEQVNADKRLLYGMKKACKNQCSW